jgi:hypothetical protein
MWLFTKYCLFSTVCARKGFGAKSDPVDPDRIMVRARSRSHLEHLQTQFPELGGFTIEEFKPSDYRYRLIVPKSVWLEILRQLGEEIDYDNFKREAGRTRREDHAYLDVLTKVWLLTSMLERN